VIKIWQENLFNNLLVAFILIALFAIIYCKVTNKTITDLLKEILDIGKQDE
jgi:hypothetical protein